MKPVSDQPHVTQMESTVAVAV